MSLAASMPAARKRAHLSQAALAEAMQDAGHGHWRQNTVSRVEAGTQEPSHSEALSLATILRIDPIGDGPVVDVHESFASTVAKDDERATLVALRQIVADRIETCESSRDLPPLVARFMDIQRELRALQSDEDDPVGAVLGE